MSDEELRRLEIETDLSDPLAVERLDRMRERMGCPERFVTLPSPLPHQQEILLDDHRFKVVDGGRRLGKSLTGLICVTDGHGPLVGGTPKYRGALHGARIWWVAPTQKISDEIWNDLKGSLVSWGGPLMKNEVKRRIDFPSGGSLTIKSAHVPEVLVGTGLDGMVLDEAAKCGDNVWGKYLRPTLADRNGWGVFISTPEGANWFYDLWLRGGKSPAWRSWKIPTKVNPIISAEELESMKLEMGEQEFQRECEGEFLIRDGRVHFRHEWFRYFEMDATKFIPEKGEPVARNSCVIFLTADLASTVKTKSDFTVVQVWALSPNGHLWLLDLYRQKLEAPAIPPMLRRYVEQWGVPTAPIYVEASGPLVWINAEARDLGLNVEEVPIHAMPELKDKIRRADRASVAVEQGRVLIRRGAPWVEGFVRECALFPDPKIHDDQVDCLSYAVICAPPVFTGPAQRLVTDFRKIRTVY